ncbi:lipopolysaccharide assembly protein LapB [Pedobacter sp. MC2016-24]|uniref:tetratricopeptide repeat protein n=1 Tax=Pedobacter sp. MC2016-24 TaxID=2780090 RepID=UPI00187FBBFD|nr:tetratricopeptide repeat protein [Pedobacter sp. MC2016-24]MBE9599619.1 tetratricopeptide repeat protein [Pedobacter sp. MC2016-24]
MIRKAFLSVLLCTGLSAVAQQPAVLAKVDSNAIKTLFFEGLRDKLNENYGKATESFNKIIALDPNNAAVFYEIATLNYRQNKLKEAETAIQRAVVLDAENVWYWKMLAELYKRKGDMESLTKALDQLIRLDPDNDAYYFDHSNALLLSGKTAEALKGYDAIGKKFGSSVALTQARQRISLGTGAAIDKQAVDKIVKEEIGDVRSHVELAGALMQKKQFEPALSVLRKARLMEPQNYQIDLAMADAYKALQRYPEAITSLKSAFEDPEMPADQQIKIVMMLLSGADKKERLDDAMVLARTAVKLHPGELKLIALYGDALYEQDDLTAALTQFEQVLKVTDQIYGVWERVVIIQIRQAKFGDAIKTADAALSVYPNQAILFYYMALALHRNHQDDEALKQIQNCLQLDAENGIYLELYGDILYLKGDHSAGLVQWKKAQAGGNQSKKLIQKINEKKYME